jgi:hypothetical protein
MSYLDEPKSWYCFQKCGCVLTSSRHPWVRRGLTINGEYENICESHRRAKTEKHDAPHQQSNRSEA